MAKQQKGKSIVKEEKDPKEVIDEMLNICKNVREEIDKIKPPKLRMPIRSLSNVAYSDKLGYFTLLDKKKVRTMSANTIKTFAQSLLMMKLSKEMIETQDQATKRDVYYQAYNWGDAAFANQPESDTVMEDIEAMLQENREKLGFVAGEKGGGLVAGDLTVVDWDPEDKKPISIDCTKFGTGAYSIPSSVEHFKFKTKAKFILCIETVGVFERLNRHKYWRKSNCILIGMGGVPTRSTRRFVRKLSDEHELPVFVFTDGDPYGYGSIYRTLKVGSGNVAHINEFFCVPKARFIGVTPEDIENYKLPTHKLKDVDVKKIKDLIKNDPFIQHHKPWQKALQNMAKMKVRVEQQALSKHGLNYVMDTYLPEKLSDKKLWLP